MTNLVGKGVLAVIALSMMVPKSIWAASDRDSVQVEGDRLTVHAANVALKDLLMSVSKKTGVEFIVSEGLAEECVSLEFDRLPLAAGIEKIVRLYNHAAINDEAGKLSKVFVFAHGKNGSGVVSVITANQKGENQQESATGLHSPEAGRDSKDNQASVEKGEQPPGLKDDRRYFPGPPKDQPYTWDGPPTTETENMPGPPDIQVSSGPPPVSEVDDMSGPSDIQVSSGPPPVSEMEDLSGPPDIQVKSRSLSPNSEIGRQ